MLDDTDIRILNMLQEDGRVSNAELARRIDLSQPATYARVKNLEDQGYIRGYTARLDAEKVGYDLLCFVRVTLQLHSLERVQAFRQAIQEMPEVLECHHVTGDFDYLLKVALRSRKDLERFLVESLTPAPGVARIHTNLVLNEIKSTTSLQIV